MSSAGRGRALWTRLVSGRALWTRLVSGRARPGLFLPLVFLALPIVIVFAPNGTVILVILAALALSAAGPAIREIGPALRLERGGRPEVPMRLAFAGLVILAAASLLWTPAPGEAGFRLGWLAALLALGAVAVAAILEAGQASLAQARTLLVRSGFATLLLLGIEGITGGALTKLVTGVGAPWAPAFLDPVATRAALSATGRGGAILCVLVWPLTVALARTIRGRGERALAYLLPPAAALFLLPFPMTANFLALGLGAAVFLAVRGTRPRIVRLGFAGAALLALAAPAVTATALAPERVAPHLAAIPMDWQHRIATWQFATARIIERPMLGWGFDAARRIPGGAGAFVETRPDGSRLPRREVAVLPLHPHNAALQAWLELGLGGALLLALLIRGAGAAIARIGDRNLRAAAAASAASFLVYEGLNFGLWQSWWIATGFLAALTTALLVRTADAEDRGRRRMRH